MSPSRLSIAPMVALSLAMVIAVPISAARCQTARFDTSEWTVLFDGKSLAGWVNKGGRYDGEAKWTVEDGVIVGREGENHAGGLLYTSKPYTNFLFSAEVFLTYPFDSGIFVRMVPKPGGKGAQVTLDYRSDGEVGAIYADGFLAHNETAKAKWKKDAWNRVEVRCVGRDMHVQAWLNGERIADHRNAKGTEGFAPSGLIGLQVHGGRDDPPGSRAMFRDIRVRELPHFDDATFECDDAGRLTPTEKGNADGWRSLFDGESPTALEFVGPPQGYAIADGCLVFLNEPGAAGVVRTLEDFRDFELRLDFAFERMANSGVFLRAARDDSNAAFSGSEIQILDDFEWETVTKTRLKPWQFTGSLYGALANPDRSALKPAGRWNTYDIRFVGSQLAVRLNDRLLYDVDTHSDSLKIEEGRPFAERAKSGFIGFQHYGPKDAAKGPYLRLKNLFVRTITEK